jgi:hypothetical protein
LGLWDEGGGEEGSGAAASMAGRWRDLRLSRGEARALAGRRHARGHCTPLSLLLTAHEGTANALWAAMCAPLQSAGAHAPEALFEARALLHSAVGLGGAAPTPAEWAASVEEAARKRRRGLALTHLNFVAVRLAGCIGEEARGTLVADGKEEEEEEEVED